MLVNETEFIISIRLVQDTICIHLKLIETFLSNINILILFYQLNQKINISQQFVSNKLYKYKNWKDSIDIFQFIFQLSIFKGYFNILKFKNQKNWKGIIIEGDYFFILLYTFFIQVSKEKKRKIRD